MAASSFNSPPTTTQPLTPEAHMLIFERSIAPQFLVRIVPVPAPQPTLSDNGEQGTV
jgi:hypothetical protein